MKIAVIAFLLALGLAGAARADGFAEMNEGWNAYLRSDYDKAIALYTRALASGDLTGRELPNVYHNRGRSLHALGRYDEAIADYGRIIDLNPYFEAVYISRGQSRQAKGDSDGAVADFSMAIELAPKSQLGYIYRAAALKVQGLYDRAIADQTTLIALAPHDAIGYAIRCETYELISKIPEAVADCKQALSLDPGNVGARAALDRMGVD